jgi:hypothetical protein
MTMDRNHISRYAAGAGYGAAWMLLFALSVTAGAQVTPPAKMPAKPTPAAAAPAVTPRLDLTEWRYRDGLEPSATAANFDDSKWELIHDPATGRGNGGASYGWYRAVVTVPERLGTAPVAGKPLQLSVLADDYAEVWIDGDFKFQYDPDQSPAAPKNRPLGYEIAGLDKANVVFLGAHKPGDKLVIAIVVANGPLGKPVGKYLLRHARLQFAPVKS